MSDEEIFSFLNDESSDDDERVVVTPYSPQKRTKTRMRARIMLKKNNSSVQ